MMRRRRVHRIGILDRLARLLRRPDAGDAAPCASCGGDARFGGRACKRCLKAAKRRLREAEGTDPLTGRHRTLQGFLVQSEGEAAIADHLFRRGVLVQYEPRLGTHRPDFLVPTERVIIEYYGMKNKAYHARRERKEAAYARMGYRVIAVKRTDLPRLGEILKGLGDPPHGLRDELRRQEQP